MDMIVCSQCGAEITGKGIHFRSRHFCSDECCEEFEAAVVAKGEPDPLELASEATGDSVEEDLGYRNDSVEADDILDDDFDIRPEDF